MSMSDCERCWDTPCTCGYGYERPRMSLDRLREVVAAAARVLAEREATGDPEPVLHPQQRFTREQWEGSIAIDGSDVKYEDIKRAAAEMAKAAGAALVPEWLLIDRP